MTSMNWRSWRYDAHRFWGWAGWCGLILSLVALLLVGGQQIWGNQQVQRLANELQQLRVQRHQQAVQIAQQKNDGSDATQAMLELGPLFPEVAQLPDKLLKFNKLAKQFGLTLIEAQYAYTPMTESMPAFYELTFPMKGKYLAIRKFLVACMNSEPALALKEVSFKRIAAESPELDAHIRLTLFLR